MNLHIKSFSRKKSPFVIEELEYNVVENKVNFLIGKNGSGKTTLLDIFLGLIKSKSVSKNYEIGRNYIYINQMIPMLESLKCQEIVQLILGLKFNTNSLTIEELSSMVDPFTLEMIKECWNQQYNHLSGGQKKLFQQMLFLQFDKAVYVLDEPTNFLDRENVHELFNVINEKVKKTFIIVTHDYRDLELTRDYHVTILDKGKIVGNYDKQKFESPEISSQFLKYFKN